MNKNIFVRLITLLVVILFIQGCEKTTNIFTPTPNIGPDTTYTVITKIVGNITAPAPQITLTPPVSDQNSVVISLSIYTKPPDPIRIKSNQKLFVVPPTGWGEFGWNLTFDSSFFRLDLSSEPTWPAPGWWIWIPLKTGQSSILINAVPPPCMNNNPPCAFPGYSVKLNIEVGK